MPKKTRNRKLPPFVAMSWDLLNSSAFKDLKPSAAKILPYFLGKPKLPITDPEYYQAEFTFSYPEARKYGFSKGTFAKCIRELCRMGFIEKTEQGGMRGKGEGYNRFKLSKEWSDYLKQKLEGAIRIYKLNQEKDPCHGYI